MKWYGNCGKILEVNLSLQKIEVKELFKEDAINYLGGAGLNAWLLYQNCKPNVKPFDSENPIIFGTGPLVGTKFLSNSRSTFTTLSPLSGFFGDANSGGYFGAMVKQAGYDHIIIRGKSDFPCYLLINRDGKCSIENAQEIWGKDTVDADTFLSKKHKGSMSACIGPAGENLVRYANILTNKGGNSWSRTGIGAVMGSKKLKAIVANGRGIVPVYDSDQLSNICEKFKNAIHENEVLKKFSKSGTIPFITKYSSQGLMYQKNFRDIVSVKEAEKLAFDAFSQKTDFKNHGCFRCPIKCEKPYIIKNGDYSKEKGPKHELGYAITLGFNVGIDNLESVLHLTHCCNKLGIDVIDFSSSVATAIDLYKNKIITKSDTDRIELDWNKPKIIEKVLYKTAKSEGFGSFVAQGVKKMADTIGKDAQNYALHIKGTTEPSHNCPAFILSFAVSTRGWDHLKGMPVLLFDPSNIQLAKKLFNATQKSMDLYSHEDKGRVIWWHENFKIIVDSLGICFFMSSMLLPLQYSDPYGLSKIYSAATGFDIDEDELFMSAERAYQIEKAFNARLGINRKHDSFNKREEKDSWGYDVDLNHPGMLDEYYQYRGCSKNGLPLRERLLEVGLKEVADELEKAKKLGTLDDSWPYLSIKKANKSK